MRLLLHFNRRIGTEIGTKTVIPILFDQVVKTI